MTFLSSPSSRIQNAPFRLRNVLPPSDYMEATYRQSNQAIINSSAALLKAQLIAGQHTLDKERFVDVAKRHGWILQIPARLLV